MEFTAKQIADFIQGRVEGDENATINNFAKIEEGQPSFAHSSGIGLSNIRNRVQGLGGNLSIKCDHGFQIFIMLPR